MMITLHVENYCHGCEDFEPEIMNLYEYKTLLEQRVCCIWKDRCARVYSAAKNNQKEIKE